MTLLCTLTFKSLYWTELQMILNTSTVGAVFTMFSKLWQYKILVEFYATFIISVKIPYKASAISLSSGLNDIPSGSNRTKELNRPPYLRLSRFISVKSIDID